MTSILGNENIVNKIARRQSYNGNRASTIMLCVELENLFLEPGGAMHRLSFVKRKFPKHKYLKLFNLKLVYLFCQNVLAKEGSVVKYIDLIKVQMFVHHLTYFVTGQNNLNFLSLKFLISKMGIF